VQGRSGASTPLVGLRQLVTTPDIPTASFLTTRLSTASHLERIFISAQLVANMRRQKPFHQLALQPTPHRTLQPCLSNSSIVSCSLDQSFGIVLTALHPCLDCSLDKSKLFPNGVVGIADGAGKSLCAIAGPSGAPITSLYDLIESWDTISTQLLPVGGVSEEDIDSVQVLPPLPGRDVLAVGKNYKDHAK
jgi:hypothetical protein